MQRRELDLNLYFATKVGAENWALSLPIRWRPKPPAQAAGLKVNQLKRMTELSVGAWIEKFGS